MPNCQLMKSVKTIVSSDVLEANRCQFDVEGFDWAYSREIS